MKKGGVGDREEGKGKKNNINQKVLWREERWSKPKEVVT